MSKRHRSPNYPVISLKVALEYLDKMSGFAKGRHFVPLDALFAEAWEMKPTSAYGRQVIAALVAFGLAEAAENGVSEKRQVRVSDNGAKIRGGHSDRAMLLKQAAIRPAIHRELWAKFMRENEMPPRATLRQYLVFDRQNHKFNESSVNSFIDEFLETIQFAQVSPVGTIDVGDGSSVDADNPFEEPSSDDEKGGSSSTNRLTDKSRLGRTTKMTTGVKEDVFSLDEGAVVLQWPERLSKESADDLKDWLELIGRKISRAATNLPPVKTGDEFGVD